RRAGHDASPFRVAMVVSSSVQTMGETGPNDALAESAAPVTGRAKHLPIFPSSPDVVPARMVNEVLYCERLTYLEWIQGEFADNFFTVDGRAAVHKRVDAKQQAPAAPD